MRFHNIDAIKRYPGINLKKTGPGWPGFKNAEQAENDFGPDLVIWYKPLSIPRYTKVKAPKCIQYNECWNVNATKSEIKTSDSKLVICHHLNDIPRFIDKISTDYKLVHNPHCAEIEIFKDRGHKKRVDVLITGRLSAGCYPLRQKLATKVKNKLRSKGYKCELYSHPGYRMKSYDDIKKQNIRYAKAINEAWIVGSDASDYKYALAKYSEIPMCGAALAGDIPKENQSWYRKWMIELNKEDSADKIADVLIDRLSDKEALRKLIDKGIEENMKYRKQEDYAKRFVNIATDFLNGKLDNYNFNTDYLESYNGFEGMIV